MRYLLVNHIPAAPGSDPAHLLLPADWARDVCATAAAAKQAGISLTIATPIADRPIRGGVEIVPDQVGFEHVALSFYDSARSYLHERSTIHSALHHAISLADVVQLDHGGYPVSLGHVADPLAKSLDRKTIWVITGDSLPTSSLGQSAGNAAKRFVGRSVDQRLQKLLIEHLRSAAGVVCGHSTLKTQLSAEHQIESECIESLDVLDSEIPTANQIEIKTKRLLDRQRPIRFAVTGELNIIAGTDHVLRALHRCLRLRVPMELVIVADGIERSALHQLAEKLGIATLVKFSQNTNELDDADVWLDSALTPAAEQAYVVPMAMGLAPIIYRTHPENPNVVTVPSGYGDGLASAMIDAATKREELVARMLSGINFARTRTLDTACRRRFELARTLKGVHSRGEA